MFNWRNIFKEYRTTAVAVVSVIGAVLLITLPGRITPEEGEIIKESAMNIWDALGAVIIGAQAIVLSLAKDQ
jgi:hypothetical protein